MDWSKSQKAREMRKGRQEFAHLSELEMYRTVLGVERVEG